MIYFNFMVEILLIIMVIIFFLVGLAGIVLPVIPSLPVIWSGILLYAIFTDFEKVTMTIVIVTGIFMVVGTMLDFVAGIFGAKAYGASWAGVLGALIGSIVGFMISSIFGIFIGAFIGAFIGEYLKYRKTHPAIKAGIGTILGFIFGVALKVFISFVIIGIFIIALF